MAEPTPTPEPTPWQRKHRPEPHEEAGTMPSNGRMLLAILGTLISTVLGIAGFMNALDSGRPVANGPAPVARDPQAVNALKRLLDRHRPPADILAEIETRLDELEPRLARVEKAVSRVRSIPNWTAKENEKPETDEMYATLRRTLGDDQKQLAALDRSRLTPDELAKRGQLAQRVENLRCMLVGITGRGE